MSAEPSDLEKGLLDGGCELAQSRKWGRDQGKCFWGGGHNSAGDRKADPVKILCTLLGELSVAGGKEKRHSDPSQRIWGHLELANQSSGDVALNLGAVLLCREYEPRL